MENTFLMWPKVELHRHIEGSMRISTFLDLARQAKLDLPDWSLVGARGLIELREEELHAFSGFLRAFSWLRKVLCTKEALTRVTYEAIADAAAENIRYLELRFNPGAMFMQGMEEADVASAICEAVEAGQKAFPIYVGIIGIIGRDMREEIYTRAVDFCIRYFKRGIDAIDLAGSETVPPEGFAPYFRRAREAGMPVTIHAGEIAGAQNIISSIRLLGARRIGHGTHLFEMEEAVNCVLDYGVAIETCLTSNLHTGAVKRLEDHPLPRMLAKGIPVSINADDPTLSRGLTLAEEYRVATDVLGLNKETLRKVILDSVSQGFRPEVQASVRNGMVFPSSCS